MILPEAATNILMVVGSPSERLYFVSHPRRSWMLSVSTGKALPAWAMGVRKTIKSTIA